jgi:hypothetical protein
MAHLSGRRFKGGVVIFYRIPVPSRKYRRFSIRQYTKVIIRWKSGESLRKAPTSRGFALVTGTLAGVAPWVAYREAQRSAPNPTVEERSGVQKDPSIRSRRHAGVGLRVSVSIYSNALLVLAHQRSLAVS